MSLPWKKPKSSRISRFISELQRSPKRGGLVVETGFPTSLIDLFVKNQDRLKKSSSKRLKRHIQTGENVVSPIDPDVVLNNPARIESVGSNLEKVNCTLTPEKNNHVIDQNNCVCGGSGAFVLMAFKIFIVALLALSTKKKLTIGITLSALALLLTELVATRVFTRRKEKPVGKNVQKIETFDYRREEIRIPKSICCLEETEPVAIPEKSNLKIRDLLLKEEKSKSKSSRLKSKIVKKLRSYGKKKQTMKIKAESLTEVSSFVTEVKSERIECKRDEERSNQPLVEESKGDKTNGIVLMIVIVLTGLLNGKILAIVLTLSCLVLRFGADKKSSGLCM